MELEKHVGSHPLSKTELKEMEKLYVEKYEYIIDLLQHIPRNNNSTDENSSENKPLSLQSLPPRLYPALKNKKTPARSVDELLTRLGKLKGVPKLAYKEKLLKKNLKNRLLKKEKRNKKKEKHLNKTLIENGEKPQKKQKPVFNSEGQMIYSKFDFSVLGAKKSDFKKTIKDPEVLLKKLNEQDKKIKSLKEEGNIEKAREIVEKKAIKTAVMRCEGISVKDDSELLKKSIKKRRSKKEKSAKKWEAREKQVKKDKEEKQKKRQMNIQARAHQKKLVKMKKAAKKGRIIPGF